MSLNTNTKKSSKASYINYKSKNKDLKCNYYLNKGYKEATYYKKYPNLRKNKDNNYSSSNKIINNTSNVPHGRVRHTGELDTFTKTTLKHLYYTNAFLELLVRRVKRSLDTACTLSS